METIKELNEARRVMREALKELVHSRTTISADILAKAASEKLGYPVTELREYAEEEMERWWRQMEQEHRGRIGRSHLVAGAGAPFFELTEPQVLELMGTLRDDPHAKMNAWQSYIQLKFYEIPANPKHYLARYGPNVLYEDNSDECWFFVEEEDALIKLDHMTDQNWDALERQITKERSGHFRRGKLTKAAKSDHILTAVRSYRAGIPRAQ